MKNHVFDGIPAWQPRPSIMSISLGNTRTRPTDGMVLVYVFEGTFLMGSTETEVTNAQYRLWVDDGVYCEESHAYDRYAKTAPVGSYPDIVSWSGILGLSGNVLEWVADWLGDFTTRFYYLGFRCANSVGVD